jgi:cell division protein FtsW (lipid II flippase)
LQQPDRITGYLETVRRQIRWKRAHPFVLEEIHNHIIDQKEAFLKEGLDEEEAINSAINEMGDPVTVGEQLDRIHRPRPDWTLLALTASMLLLGIAIQYFLGPGIQKGAEAFNRQVMWAGVSVIVMAAAYFIDFTIVGKYPIFIFAALCMTTMVSYLFGGRINGRSVNTVYLLLMFPATYAGFVYGMRNKGYLGLVLCGVAFIIPAMLSIVSPSLTMLFLLCVSCLVVLTAAVIKGWFNVTKLYAMLIIYIPTAVVLSVPYFLIKGAGYLSKRMQIAFNLSLDPEGAGYIGALIRKLLSHSRFVGNGQPLDGYKGYGISQVLPGANTDFLMTYLVYTLGWVAIVGIIAVFALFIIRTAMLCSRQKSVLGYLLSLSIILTFAVQCVVYIASNLGFLLFSPLSMPLLSYGGRAMVINMGLIGLLLSVFRTGDYVKDKAIASANNSGWFIQYDNGRIIIDFKRGFQFKKSCIDLKSRLIE